MPLLTDLLIAERAGKAYKPTGQNFLDFVSSQLGANEFQVADITARDALTTLSAGDSILVDDALADPTVNAGWAIYRYLAPGLFSMIAEEKSTDITITELLT